MTDCADCPNQPSRLRRLEQPFFSVPARRAIRAARAPYPRLTRCQSPETATSIRGKVTRAVPCPRSRALRLIAPRPGFASPDCARPWPSPISQHDIDQTLLRLDGAQAGVDAGLDSARTDRHPQPPKQPSNPSAGCGRILRRSVAKGANRPGLGADECKIKAELAFRQRVM